MQSGTDSARAAAYAGKLSRMIAAKTVWREGESAQFERFQALLAELFPHAHAACGKTVLGGAGGSLLFHWPAAGTRAEEGGAGALLLMSHQDVVDADDSWTRPPFAGEVADGRVWGRGALDIKGNLLCILQAIDELSAEGFAPSRDVYVASSNCEEVGGNDLVVDYLREHGIEIGLLVDEGPCIVRSAGENGEEPHLIAQVAVAEKGQANFRCRALGPGGHAMNPPKNSPLVRLGAFMADVDAADLFAGSACPELFDATGTTAAFTMAGGSSASNVIPREAWAVCDVRLSPGTTVKAAQRALESVARAHDVEVVLAKGCDPSPVTDANGSSYAQVKRAIETVYPGAGCRAMLLAGGTDTKHFAAYVPDCIRITPMVFSPEQCATIHGTDENIDVAVLPGGVDFFKTLITQRSEL